MCTIKGKVTETKNGKWSIVVLKDYIDKCTGVRMVCGVVMGDGPLDLVSWKKGSCGAVEIPRLGHVPRYVRKMIAKISGAEHGVVNDEYIDYRWVI